MLGYYGRIEAQISVYEKRGGREGKKVSLFVLDQNSNHKRQLEGGALVVYCSMAHSRHTQKKNKGENIIIP